MKRTGLVTCSLVLALVGDEPPKEICIFKAGINPSRKGPALFDDIAARDVMAAYKQHGADLMFDLEHLSLDDEAPNYDPDARAWSGLVLRPAAAPAPGAQYDLWGTEVRWTNDGATRLREKRQRYISPAFLVDTKSRRVVELVNVAITALPATDKLTPLVAARRDGLEKSMNPKLLKLLGLPEDADEKAVEAALAEQMKDPKAFADKLAAAMGEGDDAAPESQAMANAMGTGAGGAPVKKVTTEYHQNRRPGSSIEDELALEVRALTAKVQASEVRQLITANRRKLTPALEKWALKQSPEDLAEWLAAQPEIITSEKHGEKKNEGALLEEVKLTREDKALCALTGKDPVVFLKHKRELADERSKRAGRATGAEED